MTKLAEDLRAGDVLTHNRLHEILIDDIEYEVLEVGKPSSSKISVTVESFYDGEIQKVSFGRGVEIECK